MTNESGPSTAGPSIPGEPAGSTAEQDLAADLPVYETEQPDSDHMGVGSIMLAALAAAGILGVVLYGLNSTPPAPQPTAPAQTASSPPAAGGGAAKPAPQPGKNGHS